MPHAILHAMGVFAASNTYMRIRERDTYYIFMNQGRRLQDQAGVVGSLRRDPRIPRDGRPARDQSGTGGEARRGRAASRPQSVGVHRLRAGE